MVPGVGFHHLGIATRDSEATATLFESLLECPVVHEERFDGLVISFIAVGPAYLELLEPAGHEGVSRFLEQNGPGIHHVAFETSDIEATLEQVDRLGIERIDSSPRPGAWGHTVAFLHPASTAGVLIEFVETDSKSVDSSSNV